MLTEFLIENYKKVLDRVSLFDKIYDIINVKTDWGITEFILLYTSILVFKPRYILELGRCRGNSLYTISLAVDDLEARPEAIESICLTKSIYKTRKIIEQNIDYKLNALITIIKKNLLKYNSSILQKRDDILILYDIHGTRPMKFFVQKIVPFLKLKRHIVFFHDFSYMPGMTKKIFLDWKNGLPHEYANHCFAELDGLQGGGFFGLNEVPILLEYINQNNVQIDLPYLEFSKCVDKYYRDKLEGITNYRKDFATSLIAVRFS